MNFKPNKNKDLKIKVNNKEFYRIPIQTEVIMPGDNLHTIIKKNAESLLEDNDILFVTEKIVAISQNRAYPIKDIKPRKFATFLSKYVTKTPHGIGLGMPETMEMALQECGTPRIFFAAGVSAISKVFGRKGDFYRVAGPKARAIDGPTDGTMPPFNEYVVLGPKNPNEVAKQIKQLFHENIEVAIVDINDLGGNILGTSSERLDKEQLVEILKDNPLGQSTQGTPIGIIREVK
ncbi:MAG TPA: coenzyme F420-0:L-glutamate ligase [Erysipelothrix sp.]